MFYKQVRIEQKIYLVHIKLRIEDTNKKKIHFDSIKRIKLKRIEHATLCCSVCESNTTKDYVLIEHAMIRNWIRENLGE